MFKNNPPLISVIVPSFNNGLFILDTLKSIFDQTYPRIEIIISDDASTDFPMIDVIDYINYYRRDNIERVLINVNPINLGTVKNLEKAFSLSTGEIITRIAADDIFYSCDVFEKFMGYFETLSDDSEYLSGQVEMWDDTISNKLCDFVSNEDIEKVHNSTPLELFDELSVKCILPAQGFWKRTYFEKIGNLSSDYRIIEDHTGATRASRLGIKIDFLNYPIIKHRDGGISHGNKRNSNSFHMMFIQDEINYYLIELKPHLNLLTKEHAELAYQKYLGRSDYLEKLRILEQEKQMGEFGTKVVKLFTNRKVEKLSDSLNKIKVSHLLFTTFICVMGLLLALQINLDHNLVTFISVLTGIFVAYSINNYRKIVKADNLITFLVIVCIVIFYLQSHVADDYVYLIVISSSIAYAFAISCSVAWTWSHD